MTAHALYFLFFALLLKISSALFLFLGLCSEVNVTYFPLLGFTLSKTSSSLGLFLDESYFPFFASKFKTSKSSSSIDLFLGESYLPFFASKFKISSVFFLFYFYLLKRNFEDSFVFSFIDKDLGDIFFIIFLQVKVVSR